MYASHLAKRAYMTARHPGRQGAAAYSLCQSAGLAQHVRITHGGARDLPWRGALCHPPTSFVEFKRHWLGQRIYI